MPAPFLLPGRPGLALLSALTISTATFGAESPAALTLEAAVTTALAASPRVREAQAAAVVAAAEARAAGAPNAPVLSVSPLYSDARQLDLEAELSWTIFDPTVGPAGRAARAALAAALLAVEEARAEVSAEVREAFVQLAGSQELVAATRQDLVLAGALRDAAARARELGERPGADVLRAELELGLAQQELAAAEATAAAARVTLNSLLGREPDSGLEVAPAGLVAALPAREVLLQRAAGRPRLQAAALTVEQRRRLATVARAQRAPSVEVAGFREDEEHGLRVSVSLPLFDLGRVRGEVTAAEAAATEAEQALAAAQREVTREVDQARVALSAALARRASFGEAVLARAERLAELTRLGYETGELSMLEVLDARRQQAAARREAVALDLAAAEAWSALERAIGGPLDLAVDAAPRASASPTRSAALGPPAPVTATAPSRLAGGDR